MAQSVVSLAAATRLSGLDSRPVQTQVRQSMTGAVPGLHDGAGYGVAGRAYHYANILCRVRGAARAEASALTPG